MIYGLCIFIDIHDSIISESRYFIILSFYIKILNWLNGIKSFTFCILRFCYWEKLKKFKIILVVSVINLCI